MVDGREPAKRGLGIVTQLRELSIELGGGAMPNGLANQVGNFGLEVMSADLGDATHHAVLLWPEHHMDAMGLGG